MVAAVARRMVRPSEVEDVVQDTLLAAVVRRGEISAPYLRGIARHMAVRCVARRWITYDDPDGPAIRAEEPQRDHRELLLLRLQELRGALSERAQAVALLAAAGASIATIARDLGLHRTQVYRCLVSLQKQLSAAPVCHPRHYRVDDERRRGAGSIQLENGNRP